MATFPKLPGVSPQASVLHSILSGRVRGLEVPAKRVPKTLREGLAELEKAGLAIGTRQPDGKVRWRAVAPPTTPAGDASDSTIRPRLRLIRGDGKTTSRERPEPPPKDGAA